MTRQFNELTRIVIGVELMSNGRRWSRTVAERFVKGSSEEFASTRLSAAPIAYSKGGSDKCSAAAEHHGDGDQIYPDFATRLNRLMTLVHPPGRGPFRAAEVARAMRYTSITPLSQPYLSQLRAGTRTNPSAAAVTALADFFGVDPLYFSDDDYFREIDRELDWLNIFRDWSVQNVAMRVAGLSRDAQDELVQLADDLRRKEGLADAGLDDRGLGRPARIKEHV